MKPKDVAKAIYHTIKNAGKGKTVFAKINDDSEGAAMMAVTLSLPKSTEQLREYLYENDAKTLGVLEIFSCNNDIVKLAEPEVFASERFAIDVIQAFIADTMEDSLYWKQKNGEFCAIFEYTNKRLYCIRTCVYVGDEY